MNDETTTEGTEAPADAAAPSSPAAALVPAGMDAQQIAELAAGLDWKSVDLDCPAGFCALIGAEPSDLHVTIVCECGTKIRVHLDGEHMSRCPSCKTLFRHLVVIQAEDADESGAALAVEAILGANR
jgi:hypothetical protein